MEWAQKVALYFVRSKNVTLQTADAPFETEEETSEPIVRAPPSSSSSSLQLGRIKRPKRIGCRALPFAVCMRVYRYIKRLVFIDRAALNFALVCPL